MDDRVGDGSYARVVDGVGRLIGYIVTQRPERK